MGKPLINSLLRQERRRIILKQIDSTHTIKLRRRLIKQEFKLINSKVSTSTKTKEKVINMKTRSQTAPETSGENVLIINSDNLEKFLESLDRGPEPAERQLVKCSKHMNTGARVHWTSPLFILKAIRDCIFNRKWDNLTQLLIILVNIPSIRYTAIIRHVCRILETLHPTVIDNDLQGQFELIHKAYIKNRRGKLSSQDGPVVV